MTSIIPELTEDHATLNSDTTNAYSIRRVDLIVLRAIDHRSHTARFQHEEDLQAPLNTVCSPHRVEDPIDSSDVYEETPR
ncbi:hypothetical protein MJO28_016559 [Puccinia striiformis f. sp. tritici]|uniref:Uncharacterized protein n=1 Tax=Puccinia striiformis f. sp. tritici TaxID=168172 RepID=A0ACC0DNC3_9BASI|nr:hypothetical protein MJO28_016559 [Puccinia striiformis f. sp. tritici]